MKRYFVITALIAVGVFQGCSGPRPTTFLHPEFNFAFVEKVAVVPFENLTQDQGAAYRATRFFITELLAAEAFDVVEPGEVSRVMRSHSIVRTAELTEEEILSVGRELGVQALFLGSIGESSTSRSGTATLSYSTLTVRLVETETGATVWSATHTEGGRGFWSALFGTGTRSPSEVTRACVAKTLGTLIR